MHFERRPKQDAQDHLDALLDRLDEQSLLLELFEEDRAGVERLLEGIDGERRFQPVKANEKLA
jgi:hypothetical protein